MSSRGRRPVVAEDSLVGAEAERDGLLSGDVIGGAQADEQGAVRLGVAAAVDVGGSFAVPRVICPAAIVNDRNDVIVYTDRENIQIQIHICFARADNTEGHGHKGSFAAAFACERIAIEVAAVADDPAFAARFDIAAATVYGVGHDG